MTAVHPLTGRCLPVFVVPSHQFGEYNDVDLGKMKSLVICLYLPRFRRELKTFLSRQSFPSILLLFFSVDLAVFT